jgi:glycosyltransferase involved in cell wall biosynthesis
MVRDEADIIESTVRRMLTQVDEILIADNLSTDETPAILHNLSAEEPRLVVIADEDPAYNQTQKMSALAEHVAKGRGAEWVVPFDADEMWFSPWGRIADVLLDIPESVVMAPWYDHVCTTEDANARDPIERMRWRRRVPNTWPKVACRPTVPVTLMQGNHDAHYEAVRVMGLEVRHFPHRSQAQMERKVRNGVEGADAAGHANTVLAHWRETLDDIERRGARKVWRHRFLWQKPRTHDEIVEDPCPI